ncbi:FkbM family methyltransferase [Roseomonas populi]|uniref:FkbM family methyltransferase n=1 Tax=Roseomonas populi TaxID=3121582 RepID=A0ABT1XE52_9PROT|nr:FkbM family methyltransferase [Roseomonas pecuniae]MCR0985249.1 FkbM family methyltransferase [Roseomonas pecuniae]
MSDIEPSRPILRRAGRVALRGLRPLALPFLHRIQLRVRQAAESAAQVLLGRLDDLSARVERVEAHLRSEAAASERATDRLTLRIQALQLGIDALRLEQGTRQEAITRAVTATEERLEKEITAVEGRLAELTSDRAAAIQALVQGRTDIIHGFVRERTEPLLARAALPVGDALLMRLPEGFLLIPAEDASLIVAIYESGGRLEPGTVAVIQAVLREGDTVLDVGANVGLTVLPAARRVGPAGRVIAVEPTARLAELLRRSLVTNGLDGIVALHRCAAGAAPGTAELNIGVTSGHSSLLALPGSERSETVEVRTLDDLVPPGTRIHLAKIDVEGFEPDVWRGMRRILAENPGMAVLVEFGPEHLRRAGIQPGDWMAMFTGAGFTPYEVDEATGAVRPARPLPALAAVQSANLLMLRQPVEVYPALRVA